MSQTELFERPADAELTPEAIVERALAEEGPVVRRYCLISGGHDSTTTAHRCRDLYDDLAFVDTGTALPGVPEFVVEFAEWIGKPLRVFDSGAAFDDLVLGDLRWWTFYATARRRGETVPEFVIRTTPDRTPGDGLGNAPQGFPGPGKGGHRAAYARLKERALDRLIREAKETYGDGRRDARVARLTGARRHESRRRSMTQGVDGYRRDGASVWINPLNEWTNDETRDYRRLHAIPESDVSALLHRSGECNCGAFMAAGEVDDVRQLFPSWHARRIASLEAQAADAGIPRCVWGERTDSGRPGAGGYYAGAYDDQLSILDPRFEDVDDSGLCSSCEIRFEEAGAA